MERKKERNEDGNMEKRVKQRKKTKQTLSKLLPSNEVRLGLN